MASINYLGLEDVEHVWLLYSQVLKLSPYPIGGSWSHQQILTEIQSSHILGCWKKESTLVSFLIFNEQIESCDILLIATDISFQRQGYMRILLQEFLSRSQAKSFFVEVHEKNIQAQSFYASMGFVQVGLRKDFYGFGQSAYLLAKDL